jgi:hypothetical protein
MTPREAQEHKEKHQEENHHQHNIEGKRGGGGGGGSINQKQHQGRGVAPREAQKHKEERRKFWIARKKTINNTTKMEGVGFDSPKATTRERNSIKGNSRTPSRALKNSMPLGRKPSMTQHRRRGV